MTTPREAFAEIASLPDADIDLAEAALWIAAEEYPELDVAAELAKLDALAADAALRLAGHERLPDRVGALNRFLFSELAFRGNRDDYYDPRNSYLNEVLERRLGIPISLSLVYLAVAERAGVEAAGISFPGHFLLKCTGEALVVVDAFQGTTLSREECQRRLDAVAGRPVAL
ncbi:MAG: SirB1 family protein, partial [Myxococcota bacterium]